MQVPASAPVPAVRRSRQIAHLGSASQNRVHDAAAAWRMRCFYERRSVRLVENRRRVSIPLSVVGPPAVQFCAGRAEPGSGGPTGANATVAARVQAGEVSNQICVVPLARIIPQRAASLSTSFNPQPACAAALNNSRAAGPGP
jgi:hypothetical protein